MIKSILPDTYDFGGPTASVVEIHSKGVDSKWMNEKRASKVLFQDEPIKPESDASIIHLIAMGASPYYPCNKNGDFYFDKPQSVEIPLAENYELQKGLKETHQSFVTGAKVYKEHKNRPQEGDPIFGDVLRSAYNDDMHRVELLIKIPNKKWSVELEDMSHGRSMGFSMSCRVPFDVCSICGNKAPNPSEYCDHLKYGLGQINREGQLQGAINDHTDFFDISGVRYPADRIAFGLLKAASEAGDRTIGGAELSSILNIPGNGINRGKFAATLKKLAEMEKQIELAPAQNNVVLSSAKLGTLDNKDLDKVASFNATETLNTFSASKVLLGPNDFFKVIAGNDYHKIANLIPSIESSVVGVFGRMLSNPKAGLDTFDFSKESHTLIPLAETTIKLASTNGMEFTNLDNRAKVALLNGEPLPVLKKKASVGSNAGDVVEAMTNLYGQYKLAFCDKHKDDLVLTKTTLISHYID